MQNQVACSWVRAPRSDSGRVEGSEKNMGGVVGYRDNKESEQLFLETGCLAVDEKLVGT